MNSRTVDSTLYLGNSRETDRLSCIKFTSIGRRESAERKKAFAQIYICEVTIRCVCVSLGAIIDRLSDDFVLQQYVSSSRSVFCRHLEMSVIPCGITIAEMDEWILLNF